MYVYVGMRWGVVVGNPSEIIPLNHIIAPSAPPTPSARSPNRTSRCILQEAMGGESFHSRTFSLPTKTIWPQPHLFSEPRPPLCEPGMNGPHGPQSCIMQCSPSSPPRRSQVFKAEADNMTLAEHRWHLNDVEQCRRPPPPPRHPRNPRPSPSRCPATGRRTGTYSLIFSVFQ